MSLFAHSLISITILWWWWYTCQWRRANVSKSL